MQEELIELMAMARDEVPEELMQGTYFDFDAHPFEHRALFDESNSVCQAIRNIHDYAGAWLKEAVSKLKNGEGETRIITAENVGSHAEVRGAFEAIVCKGAAFAPRSIVSRQDGKLGTIAVDSDARLVGCDLYVDAGDIYVASGTTIEAGVGIKGPTIIGKKCEIRQGAYLRGDCILGDECVIRGELKNTVLMNKATFPHPSYLGDSVCGYMTHFGNQATAANLGIYEGLREKEKRQNLKLRIGGKAYDIGTPKMGVCMGDFCQIGCNSTTDPGTFLRPSTIAYTLTRIAKGFYGPGEVLKNKPMEHGVVERAPLRPL